MVAPADVTTLKYEQALAELETVITRLERGDVALDEAVECYQRGTALAQRCAELLDRTEATVVQLVVGGGGVEEERPFRAHDNDSTARAAADPVPAGGGRSERLPVPPPPGSPARARSVPPPGPTSAPPPRSASPVRPEPDRPSSAGLFPGLAPLPGEDDATFDLDDIPF